MAASITIDLHKLSDNAGKMVSMCAARGIEVLGVTKLACGMPQVAQAMLDGGVSRLGDSRLENIQRLRRNGVDCPIMLLRIPALSEVNEIVQTIDVSLNSELLVITALSIAAIRHKRVHDIIIMIELGNRREGVNPAELRPTAPGASIIGASSDHLALDMTQAQSGRIGAQIEFDMGYPAVLQAMISPYVKKRIFVGSRQSDCSEVMPFRSGAQLLPDKCHYAFYG